MKKDDVLEQEIRESIIESQPNIDQFSLEIMVEEMLDDNQNLGD